MYRIIFPPEMGILQILSPALHEPRSLGVVRGLVFLDTVGPPQSAMEWLIKRIAATQNNDALLSGL